MRVRWLLSLSAAAALIAGLVVLELWEHPPTLLQGLRSEVVAGLHWVHRHVLTVLGITAVATSLAAVSTVLQWWTGLLQWLTVPREPVSGRLAERPRAQDREVMLKRVRYQWVEGVLRHSLAQAVRLRLGLTYRRDAAAQLRDLALHWAGQAPKTVPPGTTMSELFDRLGGALLILGAPGAGKTTLLLELLQDLLDAAELDSRQPIPVVVNLSSWAHRRRPLVEWLAEELHLRYDVPRRIASAWISNREILPLLDGLDEVTWEHREACAEAINTFRQGEHGLVRFAVCSRTGDYQAMATRLRVEQAVELQPPTDQQMDDYLADLGTSTQGIRDALRADQDLVELLRSPLMLSVAALAYEDEPAAELPATGALEQRRARLFATYIERMLHHRPTSSRYPPQRILTWLTWLARALHARGLSEFHLDRLQPDWLPTVMQQRLVSSVPVIMVWLLVAPAVGLHEWTRGGRLETLLVVVGVGFMILALQNWQPGPRRQGKQRAVIEPVEAVRWSWQPAARRLTSSVALGLFFGLILALVQGLGWVASSSNAPDALSEFLALGLAASLLPGFSVALAGGLTVGLADERAIPNEGIQRSARYALMLGAPSMVATTLLFALAASLLKLQGQTLAVGLIFGLVAGLVVGGYAGGWACLRHLTLRALLVYNKAAPWQYIRFLNDATDSLFLRRAGSGYLFVHRLLQEHLAEPGGQPSIHPTPQLNSGKQNPPT
jgi:hypothetical protein